MKTLKNALKILSFIIASMCSFLMPHTNRATAQDLAKLKPIYEFKLKSIEGEDVDLANSYKGKVLMIVNTASQCGFTPQYEDLQKLHNQYSAKGFEVLGFPANDFGGQEPGTNSEIKEFCKLRFGVTFPLFQKASVSGDTIQPLFKFLTESANESLTGAIKWNFEKFIIDKHGRLVERFGSFTNPMSDKVTQKIDQLLTEP